MNLPRVVITGIGMVTPLGLDTRTTWKNLIAGHSGITEITSFDTSGFETRIAAEIRGFDPTAFMNVKEARRADRFTQLALAATDEAMQQAMLNVTPSNADRVGVVVGSGVGGILTLSEQYGVLHEKGPRRVSPFLIPSPRQASQAPAELLKENSVGSIGRNGAAHAEQALSLIHI